MIQSKRNTAGWKLGIVSVLGVYAIASPSDRAFAQSITLDGTLGPAGTLNGPIYVIPQASGQTVGNNLFHSFGQFGLNTGEGAIFDSAANINNILSRVTGGSPSIVDGQIFTSSSNVNLFLINPSGILFGPNASLNVGGTTRGSFVATTVDAVSWSNGRQFSATNPGSASSLLTLVGDPSGFISSLTPPQPIRSQGILSVYPSQSLLLLGGDIELDGSNLLALGGRVELGALNEAGTVDLNSDFSLSFPDELTRANVSITNGSSINVTAGGGGDIAINARNLTISGGSSLVAGIGQDSGTLGAQAGDIEINATERVRIEGETNSSGSGIVNLVSDRALGNAGDVIINTYSFEGIGKFTIGSTTFGQGDGGKTTITASDEVSLDGLDVSGSGVGSLVAPSAIGNADDIIINTRSLSLSNIASLATSTFGQGNAGNIQVNASESISVNSGSLLQAITDGPGNAGKIIIDAPDATVSFDGINLPNDGSFSNTVVSTSVGSVGTGQGGEITIKARSLSLTNGAQLFTTTIGKVGTNRLANAGNIRVNASDFVSINGGSQLHSDTFGEGNAGNITISAGNTVSFDGVSPINRGSSGITSSVHPVAGFTDSRRAGDIKIDTNSFSIANSAIIQSNVEAGAEGSGGNINITANSVSLTNGGQIQSSLQFVDPANGIPGGRGESGNVSINVRDTFTANGTNSDGLPSGVFTVVGTGAEGNGGNINITTGDLSLFNSGLLVASTFGVGNSGNISIQARGTISLSQQSYIQSNVEAGAEGGGGDINITANSMSLTNGGQIQSSLRSADPANGIAGGRGESGNVTINVRDTFTASGTDNNGLPGGVFTIVGAGAEGNGGNIDITAGNLALFNGGVIIADTEGLGDAGDIAIEADNSIDIKDGSSVITTTVRPTGQGEGGNITLRSQALSLSNGGEVIAQTFGAGNAGIIDIYATDFVELSGVAAFPQLVDGRIGGFSSGLISTSEEGASGNGGEINITTNNLRVADGAAINTRSRSAFTGGNITVNAQELDVVGGGQLLTTAFSSGNAGNITINASDRIAITGTDPTYFQRFNSVAEVFGSQQARRIIDPISPASGIFANTDVDSTGNGGSIAINSRQFTNSDGGRVSVSSLGQGNGGNLQIQAGTLSLDRDGAIEATTASGEGGNINISAQDLLLLRRNSNITTAARGTGNGGNIDINSTFIVAPASEDSNIIADAIAGNGGNINITTQGIFGIASRPQQTDQSDITASSQLGISGTIAIYNPEVDPSRGLSVMPVEITEATNQIVAGCSSDRGAAQNKFVITGRGGLPPNPSNPLTNDTVLTDWATIDADAKATDANIPRSSINKPPTPIIEAQGWIINERGQVTLTAKAPQITPNSSKKSNTTSCNGL